MNQNERVISAPVVTPEIAPYFEAAGQGKLLVKYCTDCNKYHAYPRALCPFCFSDKTEWREASGGGRIYSYSVLRRGVPVPYVLAYVTLDEGVTMVSNIVDCDFDKVRVNDRVRVVFKPSDGEWQVPVFTPVDE